MKTIKLLGLLVSILMISACSSQGDEPQINPEPENSASETKLLDENWLLLSESQQASIMRLNAVNDSIIGSLDQDQTPDQSTRVLYYVNWRKVASDDARGAVEGFRYGWSQGKGIFGKLSTSVLTAAIYTVAYSLESIYKQLRGTRTSASNYRIQDIQLAMAKVWDSRELENRVDKYMNENPDLCGEYTRNELKLAVIHNLVLETIESGVVLPIGLIENIFSAAQQEFFKSERTMNYYNGVPDIISGKLTISSFCRANPFPYATATINTFCDGIMRLPVNDLDVFENKTKELSAAYISEVSNIVDIEEDPKSNLITSFYIAPLSIQHWRSVYD